MFLVPLIRCNLRFAHYFLRTVCEVNGPNDRKDRQLDFSLWNCQWNILSPTNDMQFTDRRLYYTDRVWRSRSVRTVRTVNPIPSLESEIEIF